MPNKEGPSNTKINTRDKDKALSEKAKEEVKKDQEKLREEEELRDKNKEISRRDEKEGGASAPARSNRTRTASDAVDKHTE